MDHKKGKRGRPMGSRKRSDEELLALYYPGRPLRWFLKDRKGISLGTIYRRFGSWKEYQRRGRLYLEEKYRKKNPGEDYWLGNPIDLEMESKWKAAWEASADETGKA